MGKKAPPWRDTWRNALFRDARLGPYPRLVASVFQQYAANSPDGRAAWLTLNQLEQETQAARTTVTRALKQLREHGWLTETEPARGRRSAVYALTIPEGHANPSGSAALPQTSPEPPASSSGELPQTSSGALPLENLAVAFAPVAVAFDPRSSSGALPNQEITRSIPPTPRSIAADLLDLNEDDDEGLLEHLPQLLEDAERRMGQPIRSIKHFLTSKRANLRRELEQLRDAAARQPAPLRAISTANDPLYDGPTVTDDFLAAMREKRHGLITELAEKRRIP